jgi:hypothetical protein
MGCRVPGQSLTATARASHWACNVGVVLGTNCARSNYRRQLAEWRTDSPTARLRSLTDFPDRPTDRVTQIIF